MSLISVLTRSYGKCLFLPAHGRGSALPSEINKLLSQRAGFWDIPEIPQLGGPLEEQGEVALSQEKAAEAVGAEHGWFGVNGATGLLQAALLAIAKPGQYVLMPRNVHRSLIQACFLGDITPVLFDLPFMEDRGHFVPADDLWMDNVLNSILQEKIDIAAAVILNPTYHGYAKDINSLINRLQSFGWPVLVDESHGAFWASRVDQVKTYSGLSAGADIVVHSLHKSGTGLAQTAVLWSQGTRVDPSVLSRTIGILQTSSPSALLLASCEQAISEWFNPSGRRNLIDILNQGKKIAIKLRERGFPLLETQDPLRLIWHTASEGISGLEADAWLINKGLIAELPEPGCLTFCLGFARHRGLVDFLLRRRRELLTSFKDRFTNVFFDRPPLPFLTIPSMTCREAWQSASKSVDLSDSVNCVAADLICPYPPGIPIVFPGEKLDQSRVDWLIQQRLIWPEQIPSSIKIVI